MNKKTKRKLNKILISIFFFILTVLYIAYLEEPINNFFKNRNEAVPVSLERKTTTSKIEIKFIDVGQADCILITNGKDHMLIDAGNNSDGEKLVAYFQSLGIKKFDYIFATHPHEDHIGGMDDIINNFEIGTFYMPDTITTSKTFEDMISALEANRIKVDIPTIDEDFSFLNATFKILYVGEDESNLNDSSIILKMNYLNTSFLFTGDASSKVEKLILSKGLKSDVLKVGHHGSKYSTSDSFLEKVNPKYAVIQVGKNNVYNHPTDITLKKLEKAKVTIFRTDLDGTITATTNGEIIEFRKEKTDTNG